MNSAKVAIFGVLLLFSACARKPEREGYRVIAYDSSTHVWTILHNAIVDDKYVTKRLAVVFSSARWGDRDAVTGPAACRLQVGRTMIPNHFPHGDKQKEFLDIFEPNETLAITEGDGPDQVRQLFAILHEEVVRGDISE